PALPYLLTEQGNDRPRRCQYVAKPNHAEADGGVFILQTLQDEFGAALGRAHDAGWADCLVGGYQYERVGARLDRSLRKMQSAEDVVVHTFEKVVLNNVHVLVCSGVIDGVNTVHLQHFAHPVDVVYRADQQDYLTLEIQRFRDPAQFLADVVQRDLRDL